MISSEASSSWLIRHMKCFPADFSPVSVSSPVVQRHEGCVWQLDSTRSTGHPGSSPAAAQDQTQLLNWKCAGDPQHVSRSVLQTILLGGKRHPPHVHQAGTSSCSTCRLLQTLEEEEQIHPELHRAAPRPHAVPEGGERQPGHNQTPRGHFRLKSDHDLCFYLVGRSRFANAESTGWMSRCCGLDSWRWSSALMTVNDKTSPVRRNSTSVSEEETRRDGQSHRTHTTTQVMNSSTT